MGIVKHSGKVVSVAERLVVVEIINKSMCSACHARGACSVSDMKAKNIEVKVDHPEDYQVGDRVNVLMKTSSGHLSVLLSYVFPLIILMILLLSLSELLSELVLSLVVIGAISLYYFLIYLLRDKWSGKIGFEIEKIN